MEPYPQENAGGRSYSQDPRAAAQLNPQIQPTISSLIDNIEKTLYEAQSRVSVAADRLYGMRPETVERVSAPTSIEPTIMERLQRLVDTSNALASQAARLENI